jgi:ABC-type transport system involved in cytochrome bd biosynthesis fused ATPase/permease subunit
MLDYELKVMIGEVIQTIANHRTVIIASHDPYLRKMADLVVELNEGRVVGSQCIVKRDLPICAGSEQAVRLI